MTLDTWQATHEVGVPLERVVARELSPPMRLAGNYVSRSNAPIPGPKSGSVIVEDAVGREAKPAVAYCGSVTLPGAYPVAVSIHVERAPSVADARHTLEKPDICPKPIEGV